MSGLEAGLAIAGCVFGAIQAYDAAERTVKRIKLRRQARKAPAPSVFLEKSLEQGKQELERLVATGRERFGQTYLSEVDEGDSKRTLLYFLFRPHDYNAIQSSSKMHFFKSQTKH